MFEVLSPRQVQAIAIFQWAVAFDWGFLSFLVISRASWSLVNL